jgi:hypothetical protein
MVIVNDWVTDPFSLGTRMQAESAQVNSLFEDQSWEEVGM